MAEQPLMMPRRLAIRILHEAQIAQPQAIRGVVLARKPAARGVSPGRGQGVAGGIMGALPVAPGRSCGAGGQ